MKIYEISRKIMTYSLYIHGRISLDNKRLPYRQKSKGPYVHVLDPRGSVLTLKILEHYSNFYFRYKVKSKYLFYVCGFNNYFLL